MTPKSTIFIQFLFIFCVLSEDVGDSCQPNNEILDGTCTSLSSCEAALKEIRNKRRHNFMRCGFEGFEEVVCCPRTIPKFGSTERSNINKSQRVADIECQKIMAASIAALDLHILGGEVASLGEFPHMVALGYDRGDGYKFDCGGTIVSNRFVMTAAHCIDTLDRIEPSVVRTGVVEIGGSSWDDETDVGIDEIITHPNYTRKEKYHDLALIRLKKTLSFTSTLNAACLETGDVSPGTSLIITGWGQTSNTRDARSSVLLKATVTVVSSDKCGESYTNWRKLPHGISGDQLCAGDPQGIRDTCQGDSGGPLVREAGGAGEGVYRVVGVTSFGRGCGSPVPGVYTRVATYLPWIESVVWPRY